MTSKDKKKEIEILKESDTFCTKAWGGLSITPSGATAPCCLFEKTISDSNDLPYKVWETDIEEIYNSSFMKEVRRKMLNGEKVDACRQCYEREEFGGDSFRILSNYESYEVIDSYEESSQYLPVSLDLKLNNKCNLKCRMCQPRDSILVENEFRQIIKNDDSFSNYSNVDMIDPDLKIPLSELPSWENSDVFINSFKKMLPNIKKISMVGGEPLIMEQFYEILDLCINENRAKDIFVAITTNLMYAPKQKLDCYLESFHRVLFNISLDAVGKELEYIRNPSSFEKIVNNFKKIYRDDEKIIFQFTPTVQVYNVLYLSQVYLFVDQLMGEGFKFSMRPVHLTHLTYPAHLGVNILPENIRKIAVRRLKQFLVMSKHLVNNSDVMKNYLQLIRILEKDFHSDSERLFGEFLYYSDALDQVRGQKMVDFLPELDKEIKSSGVTKRQPQKNYFKIRDEGWDNAKKEDYIKAIECFEESVKLSTDKYIDFREMAWMKLHLKDFKGAVSSYESAFKLNSEDRYIAKGLILSYWHANMKTKAFENIDYAISLNPGDEELLAIKK